MKKDHKYLIVAIVLILALFIFFAAALAGGSENTSPDPKDHDVTYNYEFSEVYGFIANHGSSYSPDPGNKYVVASITLRNNSYNNGIDTYAYRFNLELNGITYESDFSNYFHPESKDIVNLNPGAQASYIIVYQVPDVDITDAKLVWTAHPRDAYYDASLPVPDINAGYQKGEGVGYYNYQLYKVDGFSGSYRDYTPESGNIYIVASVTLQNDSYADKFETNCYAFNLQLNGIEYEFTGVAYSHPEFKNSVELLPGSQYSYVIVYEVPNIDLSNLKLVWDSYPKFVVHDSSLNVPNIHAGNNAVKL